MPLLSAVLRDFDSILSKYVFNSIADISVLKSQLVECQLGEAQNAAQVYTPRGSHELLSLMQVRPNKFILFETSHVVYSPDT